MFSKEVLNSAFYQQGYNYVDCVPTGEAKMGGGCQASSLLIAVRLVSGNPLITMDDIQTKASDHGLVFFDRGYADRVSYVTIPIISASLLPNNKVDLLIQYRQEDIKEEATNVFGRECNLRYKQMPSMENLETAYGLSSTEQAGKIVDVLKKGGIAVPLVHPNTLYEDDNPDTKDFLHAVVLTGFNEETQTISVIDPGPGFSRIPEFARRKAEGKVKIPSDRICSIENADKIAAKYHPKKSVVYEITPQILTQALRYVSTTISG